MSRDEPDQTDEPDESHRSPGAASSPSPAPPGEVAGPPRRRDDLAGGGRTALSAEAALRARDLDRPSAEDLARAEAELVIVRRGWTPPPR